MELTDNDKQRIEQETEQRYSNDDFRRYDFKRGAEYATIYEREQQIVMASEAYAAGLYRASNAEDSETFEDFLRRKKLNSLKK